MNNLEEKILEAQEAYYNESPIMTDEEFDVLWDKLKDENPNSILLEEVGKDDSSIFEKKKHFMNMGSLEKVNNEKDFIKWWEKRIDNAILQYKLDGISIELIYNKGFLISAITRGNGDVGDDITKNVKKMSGFPLEVKSNDNFSVRGEIILTKEKFENKYKKLGLANPRNTASGISKQKFGEGCEDLDIIFYDIKMENHEEKLGNKEIDKLLFLENNKFKVVDYWLFDEVKDVINKRDDIIKNRDSLNFDIDGLVIKNNVYNEEDLNRKRPQHQIAFKFENKIEATKILDIYWSVSGKIITPVAILEPIELEGAIVRRASLSNPNRIRELRLRKNDIVSVSRRGQIIPYIEGVLSTNEKEELFPSSLDKFVDKNGIEWPTLDDGTRLTISDLNFPQIKLHRIKKWLSKLNVNGFGEALIYDLFDKDYVKDICDLYTLNLENYIKTTRLKKATEKAFNSLYKIKEVSLPIFISGFDIEDIGERTIKTIQSFGIDTLKKLKESSLSELSLVPGVGEYRALQLKNGLEELSGEMMKVLNFIKIKESGDKNEKLKGKSFCFTGALETMKRNEAKEKVEALGGIFKTTVAKGLDFLVNNDNESNSSKNKKAKSLEIKIITEKEFLDML